MYIFFVGLSPEIQKNNFRKWFLLYPESLMFAFFKGAKFFLNQQQNKTAVAEMKARLRELAGRVIALQNTEESTARGDKV